MSPQRSVGRFCSATTADLASLALMDAANLGVGSQVFVLSTGRSYRLSATVLSAMSPVVIAPVGGGGSWIQEAAVSDQTLLVYATGTSAEATITQNVWSALPTGIGLYTVDATKACWSVNSGTGAVTYNGPTATFIVRAVFSLQSTGSELPFSWEFNITRNGTVIGTTTAFPTSTRNDSDFSAGLYCSHISPPIVALPPGTSYQHVVRCLDPGFGFRIFKYQACYQLLP